MYIYINIKIKKKIMIILNNNHFYQRSIGNMNTGVTNTCIIYFVNILFCTYECITSCWYNFSNTNYIKYLGTKLDYLIIMI